MALRLFMKKLKNFEEVYNFLIYTVPKTSAEIFKGNKGFKRALQWLNLLGNPQDERPALHIAGTSGKGTVAYLISHILEVHGKSTMLLISPHAYDIRERIRIGGENISKERMVELMNEIIPSYEKAKEKGHQPSYFNMIVGLGFLAGAKSEVDYYVVETGLGGLLDTSNAMNRDDKVCVLTPIGYDHTNILGSALSEIASQKVGIVHEGQKVFSAQQDNEAQQVIKKHCGDVGADLEFVDYDVLPKVKNEQLSGRHNKENVVLALRACSYIAERDGWKLDSGKIEEALEDFKIPGRFEVIKQGGKEFIFDGAHNEQKLGALLEAVNSRYGDKGFGVIFASSKKEVDGVLDQITSQAKELILTKYHSSELDMYRPQPELEGFADNKKSFYIPDIERVVDRLRSSDIDNWIITGSFYLLREMKEALSISLDN